MRRIDHKIAYLLILVVFLGTGSVFVAKYIIQTKKDVAEVKSEVVENIVPTITDSTTPPVEEIKKEIAKAPPKHSTSQTATTKTSDGGQVTTISDNGSLSDDSPLDNCKPASAPSTASVTDKTGRYPTLGATLDGYLSELRWGNEINSFCGIYIEDAGKTGWSGQYVAYYMTDGGGRIISAKGGIILNSSYYSQLDLATFTEYMKLILSHEYGHHYTQYHKWVDMNLPVSVRFPDQYYSVRPLSKSSTIVDCSVSWSTCDSEIIAEDYSYLYSGFGMHQMANLFGYPSAATKDWLVSLGSGSSGNSSTTETSPPATNTNTNSAPANTNTNSTPPADSNANTNSAPASDTEKPVVQIIDPTTNPYAWDSSLQNLVIKIRSTDNVGVVNIKVYINDQFQGEAAASGVNLTWPYSSAPAGVYILKAEAYDASGNIGEYILTINKS